MFKTILVPVTGDPSDNTALETAYLVARLFDGHLECVHVAPCWTAFAAHFAAQNIDNTLPSAEVIAALQQERKAVTWRAQQHFAAWRQRRNVPIAETPQPRIVSAAWTLASPEGPEAIVAEVRFHDLVVLGRTQDPGQLGALIVGAGRPVLLAPKQAPENLAPTIALAWKDSPEAARALTAAMPLLKKADKVLVLSADEGKRRPAAMDSAERIARYLRWHGFSAEPHRVVRDEHSVTDAIVLSAQRKRADLLVMGAYGHSRLRELVLGGVTRDILEDCSLPVFLFH